jgi:cell division protein FtsZ
MSDSLMSFDLPQNKSSIIKVIGVGGGGGNAVNHMYHQGIKDVDFIICNTDSQALRSSEVPIKIQLGETLTQGRGAGNKPEKGKEAAVESLDKIDEILSHNTKMVFITAGMGGGTGTGAAPVIAEEAKELGILTVGIVTLPFRFEGKRRMEQAIEGLTQMREHVDSLLVINNEKLREIHGDLPLSQAFGRADNVLTVAAKGIAEIITITGSVNVDFADVNTVMSNSGVALMGSAEASGDNRAINAIEEALSSPLLNNNDIKGAKNILLNIVSGPDDEVRMDEIGEITDYVQGAAGMTADVIWGNTLDDSLGDKIGITIIATGFDNNSIPELATLENNDKEEHVLEIDVKSENVAPPQEETEDKEVVEFTVHDRDEEEVIEVKKFDLISGENEQQQSLDSGIISVNSIEGVDNIKKMKKQKISYSNEKDIEELENVPAYKRKNVKLDDVKEIVDENEEMSRFILNDKDGDVKISDENTYLSNNPD